MSRRSKGKSKSHRSGTPESGAGTAKSRPDAGGPVSGASEALASGRGPTAKQVTFRPLLVVLGIEAVLLLAFFLLAVRYAPPAELRADDAIALPEGAASFQLRLEQDLPPYLKWRLSGVEVAVKPLPASEGKTASEGQGRTDGNGVASLSIEAPAEAGVYRYRARALESAEDDAERASTDVALHVIPAAAKLVVTTVGGTLWSRLLQSGRTPPAPRARASQVLSELARSHTIIYLDVQPLMQPEKTRGWLKEHGFPEGALLVPEVTFNDDDGAGRWPEIQSYLKQGIASRWTGVAWCFGSSSDEMFSFRLCFKGPSTRLVYLGVTSPPASGGSRGKAALSWDAARELLEER